jgi:hypothetical protein
MWPRSAGLAPTSIGSKRRNLLFLDLDYAICPGYWHSGIDNEI